MVFLTRAVYQYAHPFELEDYTGVVMQVRVLHIQEHMSLIQFVWPQYDL